MALYTFSQWLPLLTALFVPLALLLLLRRRKINRNRPNLPPGPPKLPIIGNLHQLGHLPHRSLSKLSKQYGPIMLLQLGRVPTLVVCSADTAREVLKTHDLHFCSRPPLPGLKRLSYNFLDIAFAPYGEYWREMRKICVLHLLSVKRVQSFQFVRAEEVSDTIDSISKSALSSSPVDLTEKLFSLASRVISRIAFGKRFQGREFDSGRFMEVVYDALDMLGGFSASDFFPSSPFASFFDVLTGLRARFESCFRDYDRFYEQIIDEHLERGRDRTEEEEDIIDVLLRLRNDESAASRLTIDHIKAILMVMRFKLNEF